MTQKVVVFGLNDFAQLAHFYLSMDSNYEVAAFTVSKDYLNTEQYLGLPVSAFETIEEDYNPRNYKMFIPMAPVDNNRVRERFWNEAKAKGYSFISYVSSKATILSDKIGENCFILEDNTIQPFTSIGDNVVLWSGNHIGHHSIIEDSVFFTSHVVLSGHCNVERYSFLGVNAAVRDGVRIAEGSFVAMGATITKDTQPWQKYKGVY